MVEEDISSQKYSLNEAYGIMSLHNIEYIVMRSHQISNDDGMAGNVFPSHVYSNLIKIEYSHKCKTFTTDFIISKHTNRISLELKVDDFEFWFGEDKNSFLRENIYTTFIGDGAEAQFTCQADENGLIDKIKIDSDYVSFLRSGIPNFNYVKFRNRNVLERVMDKIVVFTDP
jgi:hypothetical protein